MDQCLGVGSRRENKIREREREKSRCALTEWLIAVADVGLWHSVAKLIITYSELCLSIIN